MLAYNQKTRPEGVRVLNTFPKDSSAQSALRQALAWDAHNPAYAAELREYLKSTPQDTEISTYLQEDETKQTQLNSGIARTPDERAAFAALNAGKLDEAQARFHAILEKDPNNGRAAAGMGFLSMRRSNFADAIIYLTQAQQSGFTPAGGRRSSR
jgi:tetratricopeptide (TPR) repeat protein